MVAILHGYHHGSLALGDTRSQGMNGHSIDHGSRTIPYSTPERLWYNIPYVQIIWMIIYIE